MSTKEWGNCTWILFHTIAEQISEDYFQKNKELFIKFIKNTCYNLPCPYCAADATKILNRAYIQKINTKTDFIIFLIQFHNIVNIKLNKDTVTTENIINTYKQVNLKAIMEQFIILFSMSYGNMKMFTATQKRQSFILHNKNFLLTILANSQKTINL